MVNFLSQNQNLRLLVVKIVLEFFTTENPWYLKSEQVNLII